MDIIERGSVERRLAAEHAVEPILANAVTLEDAAFALLRIIGESVSAEMGAFWLVDARAGVLRCLDVWHRSGGDSETAADGIREMTFAQGVGLPGRVWSECVPVWIPNLPRDADFWRPRPRGTSGPRSALAFPVARGGRVLGVIEFLTRDAGPPAGHMFTMVSMLGSQIGQLVMRHCAEAEA